MTPPRALERRYRATAYRVLVAPPCTLRVGRRSEGLQHLHARHGVRASAFLTAWNPRSRRMPRAWNVAAQRRLLAVLRQRGHAVLPARSAGPAGQWPEDSVLALGIGRDEARALAGAFGQNALLFAGADAVPRLVWTQHSAESES